MQNKFLPVLIAATVLTCGARAENETPTAPTAAPTPTPVAAPASAPAPAVNPAPQAAPAPSQVIYSPRLPSPSELTSVAGAQGLTIEQINQTANQLTVIYKNASGQTSTVAYQLLPTAGTAAPATTVVVPAQPAPTVIYQSAPRVIYYDTYDPYYYPRYYYPPVSLSLGFGYYHGWGGGHWGGGHHWR